MIETAHSPHSDQVHIPARRRLLGLVAISPVAVPAILFAGCEGAIPPRQYRRPDSHITGGGRPGRGGN